MHEPAKEVVITVVWWCGKYRGVRSRAKSPKVSLRTIFKQEIEDGARRRDGTKRSRSVSEGQLMTHVAAALLKRKHRSRGELEVHRSRSLIGDLVRAW